MILIYAQNISQRLEYICKTIFKDILNISYEITDNSNYFNHSTKILINYSNILNHNAFNIEPNGLLDQLNIEQQNLKIKHTENFPILFSSENYQDFEFDIFSASFFLITRYEEYLQFTPDKHGRFAPENSIAFKNYFLQRPIVNEWCHDLIKKIEKKFKQEITLNHLKFKHIATIDLDNIYAYKGKSFYRCFGGFAKDLIRINFNKAFCRLLVFLNLKKDPFDHYAFHREVKLKHEHNLIYFIPFATISKYDVNVPPSSKSFKRLINYLIKFSKVGIHPSYQSNFNESILKKEILMFSKLTRENLQLSRQHFLMLHFPETYQKLIRNQIFQDYSMGFSTCNGFRASICNSFNFFDLIKNTETDLRVFPFITMDSVFTDHLKLDIVKSKKEILQFMEVVKKYKGLYISVWHDRTFSKQTKPFTWKELYEWTMEEAKK